MKLLGVGRSKENLVVVVMQGLPSDLDSDVEVEMGDLDEENDKGGEDKVAKKRLKLVYLRQKEERGTPGSSGRPEQAGGAGVDQLSDGKRRVWREMEEERI